MKSLLTTISEISAIEQAILANNGELTPEIEAMLDLATGDLASKLDRYKHVMDAFEWRAAQFKSLKDQAAAAQKQFEGLRERLKDNLKEAAKVLGPDLEGNDWRFKVSELKPKIVFDGAAVPLEFCKQEIKWVPDREVIEKALMLKEFVPGAHFAEVQAVRVYPNTKPKTIEGK